MANWLNTGIENCDLECGMECFINRESIGYTQGECSFTGTTTEVELYQGQPSILVGKRIARIEATVNLSCLEMTPTNHALASSIGTLVETNEATPANNEERLHIRAEDASYLNKDDIKDSSIVVKNDNGSVTYTLNTDYRVVKQEQRTGIQRVTGGAIPEEADIKVEYEYTAHSYTPYLLYGAPRKAIEVGPIVFHKYNPDAIEKAHHIIICWKGVAKGDYTFTYNQDSNSWMSLDLSFGLLSDAANTQEKHDLCPLVLETWQDSFDINNLPKVPDNYTIKEF